MENRQKWRKLVAKSSDETFSNTCFIYSKTIFKTGYKREKCKCSFRYESWNVGTLYWYSVVIIYYDLVMFAVSPLSWNVQQNVVCDVMTCVLRWFVLCCWLGVNHQVSVSIKVRWDDEEMWLDRSTSRCAQPHNYANRKNSNLCFHSYKLTHPL